MSRRATWRMTTIVRKGKIKTTGTPKESRPHVSLKKDFTSHRHWPGWGAVADILPILGLTAAATFLAQYRTAFMLVGLG
jgi:hypothetical protein